uniref:Uncharacterized protein n=1 Tax=Caenorhabditis japonica TaxID=281687 RepID=A0A8R1ISS6_CAEJA
MKKFQKYTSMVSVVELIIFFSSLAIYHFFIFRKKLAREIEIMRIQNEKLERISKGEPEPELLSPTQLSELEADKTQQSEKVPNEKVKKVKKAKKSKKKKATSAKKLALEKTQTGESEKVSTPKVIKSPLSQKSITDPGSENQENATANPITDLTLTRTPSLVEQKPVYSPNIKITSPTAPAAATGPAFPPAILIPSPMPPPIESPPGPEAEEDMKTARDVFWQDS